MYLLPVTFPPSKKERPIICFLDKEHHTETGLKFWSVQTPRSGIHFPIFNNLACLLIQTEKNLHSSEKTILFRYSAPFLNSLWQCWSKQFLLVLWSSVSDLAICSSLGKRPYSFRKDSRSWHVQHLFPLLQHAVTFVDCRGVAVVFYFSSAHLFVGVHFLLYVYEFVVVGSFLAIDWS